MKTKFLIGPNVIATSSKGNLSSAGLLKRINSDPESKVLCANVRKIQSNQKVISRLR